MNKEIIIQEQGEKAFKYISQYVDVSASDVDVVKTTTLFNIKKLNHTKKSIVNLNKINDIKRMNEFFKACNEKIKSGGIFVGCVETNVQRRKRLFKKYPIIIAQIYFIFDFIFKRVLSKLWISKWFYFFITAGRNQVISKAESLGRLVYCGFEIIDEHVIDNINYFVAKKIRYVESVKELQFGILFKMNRIGENGKTIQVYKIRTMHPYAEYLQEYIYQKYNLQKGGKFKNDFRITSWGRVLRKLWIDEIPMFFNLLKGQLKFVGVRPLSKHYLSLYDKELNEIRKTVKPGLIPPYYADLPHTLQEIMESERNYIQSYKLHPFATDWRYFFKASSNILIHKARSN